MSIPLDSDLDRALAALVDGDFYGRWQAIAQLKQIGRAAIPALVALLADESVDLEQCWFVARALGEFDDPAAVRSLVGLLSMAQDAAVQAAAAEALGKLAARSPELRSAALSALGSYLNDAQLGPVALGAIAQIPHPEAITLLMTAAQSPNPSLRVAAIEALSLGPDSRIPALLLAATDDPEAAVRAAAAAGLGGKRTTVDAAEHPAIVAALGRLLADAATATAAATALGRWNDDRAVAALADHWEVGSPGMVARILAQMGLSSALAVLADRLPQEPMPSLVEGIRAIGQAHPRSDSYRDRVTALLLDWLDRPDPRFQNPEVQRAIVEALGNLQSVAAFDHLLPRLIDRTERPTPLQLQVFAALRQIDPHRGADRLAAWLADPGNDPQTSAIARQFLQEWRTLETLHPPDPATGEVGTLDRP